MKKTVLSGMRPTGVLHFGNYFGALENWIKLQDEYDCYYFVADWHALTTGYENTEDYKTNITEMIADWISTGLDPKRCVFFLQSSIKEHAELNLLLSMITPLPWLTRNPTYKDQLAQIKEKNITTHGFLGYPCLQAADILMYKADFVPVGEDQIPHLELSREIARRFNFIYKEVFPEPQQLLTKAKVLPGLDGRKMSKTYQNTIAFADTPKEVKEKVMSMVTDPARIKKTDLGHPDICTVYAFHKIFNEEEVPKVEAQCKVGEIGCVQCKRNLAARMEAFHTPIHEKRIEILKHEDDIKDIIRAGNAAAQNIAEKTMKDAREAMKIDWI